MHSLYTEVVCYLKIFSTMVPKTSALEVGIHGREASVSNSNLVIYVVRSILSDVFDNNVGTPLLISMTSGLVSPATVVSAALSFCPGIVLFPH